MVGITNRHALWKELSGTQTQWDMIIVGGGITGAGILREAARIGLKALLIEQKDYAWGTSSRSSKMVHGGLRYIAQGDIKLTKHSVEERERLIREAPGLVDRLGYLFTIRKGQFPGKIAFNTLLKVYDGLAGTKTQDYFDKKALLKKIPGLNEKGLKGASYYTDAATDDARLTLRVLQEAIEAGGRSGNYLQGETLLKDAQGKVTGITIKDMESGETTDVNANVVINATGAWVDKLRSQVINEHKIRPLRGSHIILPHSKAPVTDSLTLFHPKDKRPVFVFPWEGATVIGTTDLDHKDDLMKEPSISQEELNYLLEITQFEFPEANIADADIISTYAGVRPVISSGSSKDPSKEKREHAVWSDKGLISVSGGKLTTFRLIALDVIKAAKISLGIKDTTPTSNHVIRPTTINTNDVAPTDLPWSTRLIGRYGDNAKAMFNDVEDEEKGKIDNTLFCLAELRWAARHESVIHLDDLLLRRSRLGSLLPNGGENLMPRLEPICKQELNWDDKTWQAEKERYLAIWKSCYSLPTA
ncbi:FAD-dependent oxidoreductase [Gammaproteobacteria bacterium 45_16_T64]|mgnify:CR=1 FL=1|nr:FAD-dependent oxidoreductase [Gammaproteobacteria bacterium 45_16_T64]